VRGMVRCHGETWSAHSDALPPPERGDRVCVLAVEHLTLEVVKTKDEEK
jgi:membrane-bound ClpP family serine protease